MELWILISLDDNSPETAVGPFSTEEAARDYAQRHPTYPSWAGNYGWFVRRLQAFEE